MAFGSSTTSAKFVLNYKINNRDPAKINESVPFIQLNPTLYDLSTAPQIKDEEFVEEFSHKLEWLEQYLKIH